MYYDKNRFYDDVFHIVQAIKKSKPTVEECKAMAHHMEYNTRADRKFANNGHCIISRSELRLQIVDQLKKCLMRNDLKQSDIDRYVFQYRNYKSYQKNWQLTAMEYDDLQKISLGSRKPADFSDKDYLKNLYIKYFNQKIMPTIKKISYQEKNHLKYHGIWHTEQVALFAIDISVEDNMNPLPNLLAAALHDCARKSDEADYNHGKNCEPIARNFLDNLYPDEYLLTPQDKKNIIHAVTHHNVPSYDKSNIVLNCLQDADSMRLWWERGQKYAAKTSTGAKLAARKDHKWMQIKYLAAMIERMRAFMPLNQNTQNTFQQGYIYQVNNQRSWR